MQRLAEKEPPSSEGSKRAVNWELGAGTGILEASGDLSVLGASWELSGCRVQRAHASGSRGPRSELGIGFAGEQGAGGGREQGAEGPGSKARGGGRGVSGP